jgi:hypothetical protein
MKFFAYPAAFYGCWVTVYAIIQFVICKSNIKRNKYETLYTGTFENLGFFKKQTQKYGDCCGYMMFLTIHYSSTILYNFISMLCFYWFGWHLFFLLFFIFTAIKNAAGYYMEYFSKRNETRLAKLREVQFRANIKVKAPHKTKK